MLPGRRASPIPATTLPALTRRVWGFAPTPPVCATSNERAQRRRVGAATRAHRDHPREAFASGRVGRWGVDPPPRPLVLAAGSMGEDTAGRAICTVGLRSGGRRNGLLCRERLARREGRSPGRGAASSRHRDGLRRSDLRFRRRRGGHGAQHQDASSHAATPRGTAIALEGQRFSGVDRPRRRTQTRLASVSISA